MIWLLTYLCPPLALLFMGKPFRAIWATFLCLFLWTPGVRYSQFILYQHMADKRNRRLVKTIDYPAWTNRQPISIIKDSQPIINSLPSSTPTKALRSSNNSKRRSIPIVNDPGIGINGTRFRRR